MYLTDLHIRGYSKCLTLEPALHGVCAPEGESEHQNAVIGKFL